MAHSNWVTWGTVLYHRYYLQARRKEGGEGQFEVRGKGGHSAEAVALSQDNKHGVELEGSLIQHHFFLPLISYVLY